MLGRYVFHRLTHSNERLRFVITDAAFARILVHADYVETHLSEISAFIVRKEYADEF